MPKSEEISAGEQLIDYTNNPQALARRYDGKRIGAIFEDFDLVKGGLESPTVYFDGIAELAQFVAWPVEINGQVSDEIWKEMKGFVLPLRIPDNAYRLKADQEEKEREFGFPLMPVIVRMPRSYPYRWNNGFINPEDLKREPEELIREIQAATITAEENEGWRLREEVDWDLVSVKKLALFAKLSPGESEKAPDWEELFLYPYFRVTEPAEESMVLV